jgi:hypothetical protein
MAYFTARSRLGEVLPTLPDDLSRSFGESMRRFATPLDDAQLPLPDYILPPVPGAASSEASGRRLRSHLSAVFGLIDRFLRLSRLESERHRLDGLVQQLVVELKACFVLAAKGAGTDRLRPGHQQCLLDLDELLQTLRLQIPMSTRELAHALDDVVIQCLVLDSEQRDHEQTGLHVEPAEEG